ncbi:MAG TPA: MEDS domain-containing protein [Nocardioidaceae bacterium]|nr:MEDS domain-containing protein [Nocardioidaceae bacterium]
MRRHGLTDSPRDIGANGHACWSYESVYDDFLSAATIFLDEGRALGQRLMFVGGPEAERVVRESEPLADLVAAGTLQIAPFDAIYPGGRRMASRDQWALYSGATDQALADGFTGLRVLAEVTSLAEDDGHEHAVWESYADRLMANRPLAALCCFDRAALSDAALAAIGSAHPVTDERLHDLVPFRLYGETDAIALAGEVDVFSAELLDRLLRAGDRGTDALVLDVEGLTFIDHTGMRAIQRHARRIRQDGGKLVVRGHSPVFRRLSDLLGAEF